MVIKCLFKSVNVEVLDTIRLYTLQTTPRDDHLAIKYYISYGSDPGTEYSVVLSHTPNPK